MKPDLPVALGKLSQALLVEVCPAIAVDYLQRSAGIAAIMLQVAAAEWDRAAARRAEENAVLRALFRDAAGLVDGPLRARLQDAAAGSDADLRLGALDAANRALRALLVDLHARVETLEGADARRLEAAIWSELRRSTERRTVPLAPF